MASNDPSSPKSSAIDDRFDGLFTSVASAAHGIEPLLDLFFSFLQRKTDFYAKGLISGGKDSENPCKEMVLRYFRKHEVAALKKIEEDQRKSRLIDEERRNKLLKQKMEDEQESGRLKANGASCVISNTPDNPKIVDVTDEEQKDKQKALKNNGEKSDSSKKAPRDSNKPEAKDDDSSDDEDGGAPPPGNGGKTDTYVWTQTLPTAEVHVAVPSCTKSRDCIVDITGTSLKVGIKGKPLIIDGKFCDRVKVDDCMWTLVDNRVIQITLEKQDNMKWWPCIIQGDPSIDTKKIVPENSKLSDLDGETRSTVEKMMYDQRQKAAGLPTSDQMKQHEMLEKFKKAHPEMDFSGAKINWGGGGGMM